MKPRSEFLLIIDGSSLLATSYYSSLPKAIRKEKDEEKKNELYPLLLKKDAQGRYCNALESFFHTIFTILTFQHPTHLAICWDVSRHTFRKTLWPLYKSNRSVTPAPLSEQYETAYAICDRLQIAQFRHQDFEADDFAGSLAVQLESELPVRILTRDKDYFQLITRQTRIWYGMSDLEKVRAWRTQYAMPHGLPSRVVEINPTVLEAEFGYSPSCVCMMKALFGDRSDNIPGVRGMGESRSIALARHYATPDELYEAIHAASGMRSRAGLQKVWRSWGILRSPYTCLIRKSENGRPSAEEMARLCYTLGKMKTDIDLGSYCSRTNGSGFSKRTLRYIPRYPFVDEILEEFGIVLSVGSKRPFGLKGTSPARRLRKAKTTAAAKPAKARKANGTETAAPAGKAASPAGVTRPKKQAKAARQKIRTVSTPRKQTAAWTSESPAVSAPAASEDGMALRHKTRTFGRSTNRRYSTNHLAAQPAGHTDGQSVTNPDRQPASLPAARVSAYSRQTSVRSVRETAARSGRKPTVLPPERVSMPASSAEMQESDRTRPAGSPRDQSPVAFKRRRSGRRKSKSAPTVSAASVQEIKTPVQTGQPDMEQSAGSDQPKAAGRKASPSGRNKNKRRTGHHAYATKAPAADPSGSTAENAAGPARKPGRRSHSSAKRTKKTSADKPSVSSKNQKTVSKPGGSSTLPVSL